MRTIRLAIGALFVATLAACGQPAPPPAAPATERLQAPTAAQPVAARPQPSLPSQGQLAWAAASRADGVIWGSANAEVARSTTASLIKAWIAADLLSRLDPGEWLSDADERRVTAMIRDSDNEAAETIFFRDGDTEMIDRMVERCDLRNTTAVRGSWSRTTMTAADVVRLGLCIADGRAAGPHTAWLMSEMAAVEGDGRFGVPARYESETSLKNGWLLRDDENEWHVNCLIITPKWVSAVMARYPGGLGEGYGVSACQTVSEAVHV